MAYRSRCSWRSASLAVTLPLVLQAATAAWAQAISIRQTEDVDAFLWEISIDNLTISAPRCYFGQAGDLVALVTKVEECAAECMGDARCTHFDWSSPSGGRCQLKGGPTTMARAGSTDVAGAMCGMVLPGSRDRCQDGGSGGVGRALALFGCFASGAAAAAAVAGLLGWRARRKRSTAAAGKRGGEGGGALVGGGTTELPSAGADGKGGYTSAAAPPQPTPAAMTAPRAVATAKVAEGAAAGGAAWPAAGAAVGSVGDVAALGVKGRAAAAGAPGNLVSNAGVVTVWAPPHPPGPRTADATGREVRPPQPVMLGSPPSLPPELWMTQDVEEWRARHVGLSVTPESTPSGS